MARADQVALMADDRLIPTSGPSSRFLKQRHLQWLASGENHDYFAKEILVISDREKQAWGYAAQRSFDLMMQTADRIVRQGRWRELGIPHAAANLIEYSWTRERDLFLIGRFDFAGGFQHYPLKMLEFNADTCSLLPETAVIQRHLWERAKQRVGQGPFDLLFPALTSRFEQILQQHPERDPTLLFTTLGYREDKLNVEMLAGSARAAGFADIQFADLEEVIVDPENGLYLDIGQGEYRHFSFCYKMFPWDFVAIEEPELMDMLSSLIQNGKLLMLNPAWTMLLQSKALLPFMYQDHRREPTQLAAGFSASDFPNGRYARKPIFGRTGENVALYDGQARPMAENGGDFGMQAVIYQELADFYTDADGDRYQGSVFYTDQAAALAFRRQEDMIIDDDAEYIAHTVR